MPVLQVDTPMYETLNNLREIKPSILSSSEQKIQQSKALFERCAKPLGCSGTLRHLHCGMLAARLHNGAHTVINLTPPLTLLLLRAQVHRRQCSGVWPAKGDDPRCWPCNAAAVPVQHPCCLPKQPSAHCAA